MKFSTRFSANSTNGNVLIYVLIAVVLFGLLSFTLTKSLGTGGMTGTLDSNKARLRAEELINYATGMRATVEQMHTMSNVLPNEFVFAKQGEAGYDTAPHKPRVYHPAGGGMNAFTASDEMFAPGSAKRGWVAQVGTNVEWTRSTATDVIFSFLDVADPVCKAINQRLIRSDAISTSTINASVALINGGGDDAAFTTASCADCVQKLNLCVKTGDNTNAFYNVLIAR